MKFLPISSKVWQEVLEKYSENLFYDICQENNFGRGVVTIFLKKEEMAKFYVMESMTETCMDPERGQGAGLPLKNYKNIGFISNTGPDPLKTYKATKPAFNTRPSSIRQQNAI